MEIRRLKKEDIPELLSLRIEQQKEYHECLKEEEKHIIEYTKDYINENLEFLKIMKWLQYVDIMCGMVSHHLLIILEKLHICVVPIQSKSIEDKVL